MIRTIIRIDESKCDACGACVTACHEGAIQIVDGVAKLVREDYCDGLGDCLPACPTGAITFEEREALAYDEAAVIAAKLKQETQGSCSMGCPGSLSQFFAREEEVPLGESGKEGASVASSRVAAEASSDGATVSGSCECVTQAKSYLANWPIQIKLVPVRVPYFDGADLLIAADCTAFAYGNFHYDYMRSRVTLIGCPKLDEGDYAEKLTAILINNDIRSIVVARMQVPCCGGIESATKRALAASGKDLPLEVVTFTVDGSVL